MYNGIIVLYMYNLGAIEMFILLLLYAVMNDNVL